MTKWVLALAAALVLLAAGCGGSDHPSSSADEVEVPASADYNAADVMFAQGMIPHHEQAVEMADLALANTTTPTVVELANRIKAAQDPEIMMMRGWLETWDQPQMSMDDGGHGGMDGMMTDDDMAELQAAEGAAFDQRFLDMMIRHHEGAIEMAEQMKQDGKFADAKTLADIIISAQLAEIAEMQVLLGES